ncbi:MAG: hypothetical protein HC852_00495 [Acaryochloridaceae cyanobacterium RU_4_10]|nr:hypothetical protein [Acaryochloridaceae cyanobacterium RU_4_10]
MSRQEDKNVNFVQGDYIEQKGYFVTGVDKSTKVNQAGAVGSHSKNIVHDQQIWNQGSIDLNNFLQDLKRELPNLSLTHEARNHANSKISDIEIQLKSTSPNNHAIKAAGDVLYGILIGVGGNLATKLLGFLTGLSL